MDIASLLLSDLKGNIVIKDADTNTELISQQIESDDDRELDAILFQSEVVANSEKIFEVSISESSSENESISACCSRFVPERTDDYALENNRVAFRTYGLVAQKMKENGVKGGTLSSGIDAWLKRVEYPIINKWYKKELETDGSYHKDDGEGLDNFHVGISREVGGVAKKSRYYLSLLNGDSSRTLPIPATFVINKNRIDEAAHVEENYAQRMKPSGIINFLKSKVIK